MTRRGMLAFAALSIAWGVSYLFVKVIVRELSPTEFVLARAAVAAALLLPLAVARGVIGPVLRRWRPLALFVVVELAVPWLFLARTEQTLPSSTTGLLMASVTVVGVLVSLAVGRAERLSTTAWTGVGVGLVGVAALVGLDVGGSNLAAVLQLTLVVLGYASGPIILSRWFADLSGLGVMTAALTAVTFLFVPVVLFTDGVPTGIPSPSVMTAVLALAAVSTAGGFVLLFALVGEVGPIRASTVTYVNPAVAIVAGAVVLGESVTVWTLAGFVLVLLGSVLINRRPRQKGSAGGSREAYLATQPHVERAPA